MSETNEWQRAGRKIAREAKQKSDPTKVSTVFPKGFVGGRGKFRRGGERFHTIGSGRTRDQVTARMLKGIMNVSDVVEDSAGDYYSQELPLNRIESPTSWPEIIADGFIFMYIFGDRDHYNDLLAETEGNLGMNPVATDSTNFVRDNDRIAYYDLEGSFFYHENIDFSEEGYKKAIESLSPETRSVLTKKIAQLGERFGDEGRAFLRGILTPTKMSIFDIFGLPEKQSAQKLEPKEQFDYFYSELMRRITTAKRLLSEAESKSTTP